MSSGKLHTTEMLHLLHEVSMVLEPGQRQTVAAALLITPDQLIDQLKAASDEWQSVKSFAVDRVLHGVRMAEEKRALTRAQQLWGENAFVVDQSDLNRKMFLVSSGKSAEGNPDWVVHYGEGESWDEAFIDAGASLFA
jgi:hypothetical protein